MEILDLSAMHTIGMVITLIWLVYKDLVCKQPLTPQGFIWMLAWPCYWIIVFCEYMNLIEKE